MPRTLARDMKASLRLSGVSNISMGNQTFLDGKPFTVGTWVKPDGPFSGPSWNMLTYGHNVGNNTGYKIASHVASGGAQLSIGSTSSASSTIKTIIGQWNHVVVSWSGAAVRFYINGVFSNQQSIAQGFRNSGVESTFIGATTAVQSVTPANYREHFTIDRVLTDSEVSLIYTSGVYPSGLTSFLKLEEGAGATTYDTSGNARNGTIINATFAVETPTKVRKPVNPNLVYNGDFSYAPPFTAATTTPARWIDGSAAGSLTNDIFGWSFQELTGTGSAQFDNGRLKLSTLAVSSFVTAFTSRIYNDPTSIKKNGIPIDPLGTYTLTFSMETQLNSGAAATGARVEVSQYTSAGVLIGGLVASSTAVSTTTARTTYTLSLTGFNAAARYINISPRIVGNAGAGTLILDAWFDDFDLRPTTPTTRSLITRLRTLAGPRTLVA